MSVVTLTEAKLHLRVTDTSEDTLIQSYIDAAQDFVRNYINQPLPGEFDSPAITPAAVKSAILLYVGDLYENRQAQSEKDLKPNQAVHSLLYPYRVGIGI